MNELNAPAENRKTVQFTLPLFPGLSNSLHINALCEFFLSAKRGDASKLFITTLLTLLLAIPVATLIFATGLHNASENLKQARRISVFMSPDTAESVAVQLSHMLISNKHVSNAILVPPPVAQSEIELPRVVEVMPTPELDADSVVELADQLEALAGVEFVELNVERLAKNTTASWLLGQFAPIANVVALIAAGLLMLAIGHHTARKSATTILLMKQLGGTRADVRRPFLYRGTTLGVFAATLGLAAATGVIWIVSRLLDLSAFEASIPITPSPTQLVFFCCIVIIASLIATVRIFSNIFTTYNQ